MLDFDTAGTSEHSHTKLYGHTMPETLLGQDLRPTFKALLASNGSKLGQPNWQLSAQKGALHQR